MEFIKKYWGWFVGAVALLVAFILYRNRKGAEGNSPTSTGTCNEGLFNVNGVCSKVTNVEQLSAVVTDVQRPFVAQIHNDWNNYEASIKSATTFGDVYRGFQPIVAHSIVAAPYFGKNESAMAQMNLMSNDLSAMIQSEKSNKPLSDIDRQKLIDSKIYQKKGFWGCMGDSINFKTLVGSGSTSGTIGGLVGIGFGATAGVIAGEVTVGVIIGVAIYNCAGKATIQQFKALQNL